MVHPCSSLARPLALAASLFVALGASTVHAGGLKKADSGKLSCDPKDLDAMSAKERKRADVICKKLGEKKAAHEESVKHSAELYEKFVKGHAAYETVYADHNKSLPTTNKPRGKTKVWIYMTHVTDALHSECEEFVFDEDGQKQLSTRTYQCD